MDVDMIFKIAAIGIIVAVLNQLLDCSVDDDNHADKRPFFYNKKHLWSVRSL